MQALGGLEALLKTLGERLAAQRERHAGGNTWVGTGGTSPFGSGGYNPFGVRLGQAGARQGRAAKIWEARDYQNLDERATLQRRNLHLALRRLRRLTREGVAQEFDLEETIRATTAREGGLLTVRQRPARRNALKLLLLFDIGGSMDLHVRQCEELFSACRSEFGHLEHFYFHNCPYEQLWRDNARRQSSALATAEVLRRYGRDYRVILVGDASMGPHEITQPGGSVEHWNEEAGAVWLGRLCRHFRQVVWLNPFAREVWPSIASIKLIQELLDQRVYPLSIEGIGEAINQLRRP